MIVCKKCGREKHVKMARLVVINAINAALAAVNLQPQSDVALTQTFESWGSFSMPILASQCET